MESSGGTVLFPDFETRDVMCVFQAVFNLFLFDTNQIPLPFTELKACHRRLIKQMKLQNEVKFSKYEQNVISFVRSIDSLFCRLADCFSTGLVSRIVIMTGSTPFNPKQTIVFELPTSFILAAGGPENLGYENCSSFCVQKVHRLYFSTKFLSAFKGLKFYTSIGVFEVSV